MLALFLFSILPIASSLAAPTVSSDELAKRTATVVIPSPDATVLGRVENGVESFGGIPYAEPPVGLLRMRPPKRLSKSLGTFNGTGSARACPQFFSSTESKDVLSRLLGSLDKIPFMQNGASQSEDCLSITVARPEGTKAGDDLPVLFWVYGGGFETGSSSAFDWTDFVNYGTEIGKPFVFVAVNYRVGGFGFMPGKEIEKEGSGNAGLLDQRMGLEWVADNIAAFGGDRQKVTIWGQSAGSISVALQLALFDGDNVYNGKPLFRGAIMNSGSVLPTKPLSSNKAQVVYDQVVDAAGCSNAHNSLDCLRRLSYDDFAHAANSVPNFLSYTSLALSYLPRPDGRTLTDSPDALIRGNKYAPVPMIIGDTEDEGTLFALFQPNLTTANSLASYLHKYYFEDAAIKQLIMMIETYGIGIEAIIRGSPFRSGLLNEIFPGFKRRAAILGDFFFNLSRRMFLGATTTLNRDVPSWSYLTSSGEGTPILGTLHGSDALQVFIGGKENYAARAMRTFFINFLYSLDPNGERDAGLLDWPRWSEGNRLVQIFANHLKLLDDNFRAESFNWMAGNVDSLRL